LSSGDGPVVTFLKEQLAEAEADLMEKKRELAAATSKKEISLLNAQITWRKARADSLSSQIVAKLNLEQEPKMKEKEKKEKEAALKEEKEKKEAALKEVKEKKKAAMKEAALENRSISSAILEYYDTEIQKLEIMVEVYTNAIIRLHGTLPLSLIHALLNMYANVVWHDSSISYLYRWYM
jgi:flagellar biosynthesis GTPase FlhF